MAGKTKDYENLTGSKKYDRKRDKLKRLIKSTKAN